ncbi:MAG TPA: NHLP family bacteriocin export ABC transporter peptidase/permease/ATPase subunit [Reyranella sp.]
MTAQPRRRSKRRVRTPTVLQMEATECGAAALAIVLAWFGRRVPLKELRVACGVSRDGSRAANVIRAARTYGLEAKGFTREMEGVLAGPFPVVVFWGFNHFLVVEGVSAGKVHLNDPAVGPRAVTPKEFSEKFTGVVLEFDPGPDFVPSGGASMLISRLGRRLAGFGAPIAFVVWIGLMLVIPGLILPGMTQVFVDSILVERFDNWLGPLLIGLAATFVMQLLLSSIQEMALLRIELRLALEQSALFTWHVLRLPIEFFNQRYTGDLVSRVEANDRIATVVARDFGTIAASCITALFLGVVMMFYDAILAAIAIGGAAVNILVLHLAHRGMSDAALRLATERGRLFAASVAGLQSIETLKATGTENDFFARWTGYHTRATNSEQQLAVLQQLTNLVPPIVLSLTSAAVLGVGAVQVVDGDLTVGTLVAFQVLLLNFSGPIQQLVGAAGMVQTASADLARLDDVLNHRRDWRFAEPPGAVPNEQAAGHLTLSDVSFRYDPRGPLLIENFSLDVAPGQWVALVGASGSGKSTMGRLITGLYQPEGGEVCIDGHTLAEWGRERLTHIVAAVDQDIHLFRGSIRDNVTLWDDTIPHQRLMAAIDDAGLTATVEAMVGNQHNTIDEEGRNLNGGQRQRLEIARALVQEPAVLVLDEATCALDPVSESAILDAVRRRGMTCILVAHRLSTVRDCDEIIVLERGKVVERGNHAMLMAKAGAYARLISAEATP